MRLTVLGGCGAWPAAGQACGGYLVEYDGFRLLVDPGYAVVPRLLEHVAAEAVDAVFVSHGHPDHCADLNPLLRARVLGDAPSTPLPVYAPPGALDAVLALDGPRMLAGACVVHDVGPGTNFDIGPLRAETQALPHFVPNLGVRLSGGGATIAYTGDTGPSPDLRDLADGADLLLAEATYVDAVPEPSAPYLSSARQAGALARAAGVRRLVLTHLWPGTDRAAARRAADLDGPVDVAGFGVQHIDVPVR